MKIKLKYLLGAVVVILILTLVGCGKSQTFGDKITGDSPISIKEILSNPAKFEGKTVRIEGKIVLECTTGCWFNLEDKSGAIFIELNGSGFAIPQKVGSSAIVEGKVETKNGRTMIIAKGVEIK